MQPSLMRQKHCRYDEYGGVPILFMYRSDTIAISK